MDRRIILTEKAPAPIGPYSQAVEAGGFLFCSGQIPLDPGTGELVKGDIQVQAKRVLDNLQAVLAAAGSSLDRTVKLTVYLTDLGEFAALNESLARVFPRDPPARAVVGVSALPKGAKLEMDLIASR